MKKFRYKLLGHENNASIIRDYKLAKCLVGGERRGEEREEIRCKRTSDFDT